METSKRNRAATTQRIVDAFEGLLAQKGLEGISVNAVAEQAGVTKVLIYRYFGGLEGLVDYYMKMGRMFPTYTPLLLDQLQPLQPTELASIWSTQTLQLFRQLRASKAARELLKASVQDADTLTEVISQAQDAELSRLVNQLSFVEGIDQQAISAVVLGALSYLTVLAQNNRPMIGIDLRSETGWQRVEGAVKAIYKSLGQSALTSARTHVALKPVSLAVSTW